MHVVITGISAAALQRTTVQVLGSKTGSSEHYADAAKKTDVKECG
jgi:hypothetical protein